MAKVCGGPGAKGARAWFFTGLVGVAGLMATACVGGGKKDVSSADDKERLKAYVLDAVPDDARKVDINFENKLHILGYKFEPEPAKPGTDVKLTYYWRCDDPVEEGWLLFTHLHDPVADKYDNLDWAGPLREQRGNHQALGPDHWEKGKVYVDEQTYKMPDWIKGAELTVMTGVWKGDSRLRVVSGANDGDNRAIVGKLKTGVVPSPEDKPRTEVPALSVPRVPAGSKIVVDGKSDDKAWATAASTGRFVDVGSGRPEKDVPFPVNGSAKITWDEQNLYVFFDVTDTDVVGGYDDAKKGDLYTVTGQPKLWARDTVEIMIDPDGDGDNKDYYEIQVNPQNKVFHTQYDGYNTPKTEPNGPFGHEDWDPKLKSAVVVRGTLDKEGEKDEGYSVEVAIPWAAFGKAAHHPPRPGDSWRFNFYAMQNNGGAAWSPILGRGNFHKADRFGRVTFTLAAGEAPAGATSGAPTASAAPSSSAVAPGPAGSSAKPSPSASASAKGPARAGTLPR